MWALAASASAHLQNMRESLYTLARSRLEALDESEDLVGSATLEQAQAWLLLTHYEFRYMHFRRAWITAGRAFRIIQLFKLHEVERFTDPDLSMTSPEVWVEMEERRRTFWVAYCLDRFVNVAHEWPLTLQEEAVRSHHHFVLILPSPLTHRNISRGLDRYYIYLRKLTSSRSAPACLLPNLISNTADQFWGFSCPNQ